MTVIFDAGKRWVDDFTHAGLRATMDPRNAQPPCALLQRPSMIPVGNMCANRQIEWQLDLIAKGGDNTETWQVLDRMVDIAFGVLGASVNSCDADTYPLNETTEAPSYRVVFTQIL